MLIETLPTLSRSLWIMSTFISDCNEFIVNPGFVHVPLFCKQTARTIKILSNSNFRGVLHLLIHRLFSSLADKWWISFFIVFLEDTVTNPAI